MKSLEDTFRRPRTASSLKHKKTGLELQFQPGKKWEVDSLIFSRHAKLQMLQRLLIVTAGIVGKLQLNRQVALVAYIFQSLDNGSIITIPQPAGIFPLEIESLSLQWTLKIRLPPNT